MDEHKVPIEKLLARFGTNPIRGLRDVQVQSNRVTYGANVLIPPDKDSQLMRFFKAVIGGLNSLLWGCCFLALISFGVQFLETDIVRIVPDNLILGISLVIVILVSGMFSFYQEFKSNRIMESFKKMVPHFAKVYRNGIRREIDVSELVVGDIVDIHYGDLVPADIRVLECSDFKVDNSSLTGESEPQKRSPLCTHDDPLETRNLAFFSTNALEGHCKGVVVRVGSTTLMGRLANLASKMETTKTPIGIEMDQFILIMTIRSLIFGGSFFAIAMVLRYEYLDAVFFVIGIVVANVPEGLCVTFTMILALTAKRMAKKNCLVKNLQAVETLGSTSVICSDKTGTLTQNRMAVAHMWFNGAIAEADTTEIKGGKDSFDLEDPGFKALVNVAVLCSRATFKPGQEDVPIYNRSVCVYLWNLIDFIMSGKYCRLVDGDASETAILKWTEDKLGNVVKLRDKYPKLCEIPFNSRNKFQISIHDLRDPNDSRYLLVMKGAPEKIINYCTHILIKEKEYELDQEWRDEFNVVYSLLGSFGERVLGFCDFRLPSDQYPIGFEFDAENPKFLELGFRFVGLISMIDPPRPAVPAAVAKCRSAGIKVVMVTGDHPVTATAIARAVGIISEHHETIEEVAISRSCSVTDVDPHEASAAVISGAELKLLTSEELQNVLRNYQEIVFARTSPEQKYNIVEAFQKLGYIVASTGDGVNDSPALKKADIGVAMGISGSEVSKEAADMILMDDNFATIVTGVEEGRLIFDNLKKLIAYNLADNIAEMYSVWLFILLRVPLPMGTIAMLLSVVGTDVAPAISIAHEKPEADIMKLRPRNPTVDKLVTPQYVHRIFLILVKSVVAKNGFILTDYCPTHMAKLRCLRCPQAFLLTLLPWECTVFCRTEF